MSDIEEYEDVRFEYEKRYDKLNIIRKYENKLHGIKDYYGMRDFMDLADDEIDKRIALITIEKARL